MCGIVGSWGQAPPDKAALAAALGRLHHRGPDGSGLWLDEGGGIALGHARLAILDLSPAGHQPMVSASGRFVLSFNGEIYNHLALRSALESSHLAPVWRGRSDTETLLAAFEAWGIETTLQACIGMFAIALWDCQDRTLTLARDRLGEKPLYYGWQQGVLLFGSELKALKAHPAFVGEIDREALALQLHYGYVPTPYSIYKNIGKLPAGTFITIRGTRDEEAASARPIAYWSLAAAAKAGLATPFTSDAEAIGRLEDQLRQTVALQMVADVPLGAFLSGGVDSSLIAALMQAQSSRPVRTFTIGFREAGYNEAIHAAAVARYLGTEHTDLHISDETAQAVIPRLPTLYDEPFADPSQVPTFLVSQMTRQQVAVSLSGDGGDELFGGYNRYCWAPMIWRRIRRWPRPLRTSVANGLLTLASPRLRGAWALLSNHLPTSWQVAQPIDKAMKLSAALTADSPASLYQSLVSHWRHPAGIVIGVTEQPSPPVCHPWLPDFEHQMMYLDAMSYLPDDVLVKVDRAAMSVSLETRVPMLDHRIVELAWRMPLQMKIRNGEGKWILRQVLYKYVPKALIERPKMGFAVPIDSWLRGPLRPWAEALLDPSRLRREGFLDPEPIWAKWQEHLLGRRNWQYPLWNVLMFQAWLEDQDR